MQNSINSLNKETTISETTSVTAASNVEACHYVKHTIHVSCSITNASQIFVNKFLGYKYCADDS